MQFSSKEDIEAPIATVFAMLSEFEAFERSAIRRGIEVRRVNETAVPGEGMAWTAVFSLRGKPRDLRIELAQYDPPNAMTFDAESPGLDGALILELLPLSLRRTRMSIVLNVKPKTLSARLLVQSVRLAKSNLSKRFKLRVADYAKNLEERYHRTG